MQVLKTEKRKTGLETSLDILNLLINGDEDSLYSPNNIATKIGANRQTVEKALEILSKMQSKFFDKYELDIENMTNNRKVVGFSKRRKFSEYPENIQKVKLKELFPNKSSVEIEQLFSS